MNWGPIMKTINEDPYEFFQQGGWSFLGGAAGGEEASHVSLSYGANLTDFAGRVTVMMRRIQSPSSRRNRTSLNLPRPVLRRATTTALMPVTTRAVDPTSGQTRAKVGRCSTVMDAVLSHLSNVGADWDELERKAARGMHSHHHCLVVQGADVVQQRTRSAQRPGAGMTLVTTRTGRRKPPPSRRARLMARRVARRTAERTAGGERPSAVDYWFACLLSSYLYITRYLRSYRFL